MEWVEPGFPVAPQGTAKVHRVHRAWLTPVTTGRLRVIRRPDRWITGAVHDEHGRLLRPSQRTSGLAGIRYVMADPDHVAVPPDAPRLKGRWLYGGTWMSHFGHFLTETLTTLWPDRSLLGDFDGLVFHRGLAKDPEVLDWQQRLLELTGWGGLPVHVVGDSGVQVDRVLVPTRQLVLGGWARPQARQVWRRLAEGIEPADEPPPRVYLSRSLWHAHKRALGDTARASPEHDQMVDEVLAARGFEVVAPETLTIDDQIRLVAGCEILAGATGSALHLSAVAPEGLRVLAFGDVRAPGSPLPAQCVIDAASGHVQAFAPYTWDRERLEKELDELDLRTSTDRDEEQQA